MKALTQNDEALLCGRADVIRQIVDNCRSERLTVLTGEPGIGVTSVLQAGVAPELRREGCIVAAFGDWQGRYFAGNFRDAIINAVREQADPEFSPQSGALDELLDHIRIRTRTPVAVLIDQFEDYVRWHSNTVLSDAFDAELGHAVASRKGVFVIGLHEYAIPAFGRMEYHIPNLLGFRIGLPPLSAGAARDAVLAEAHAIGFEVEPTALDALITAPVVISENGISENGISENGIPGNAVPGENKVHPFFLKVATGVLLEAERRMNSRVLRSATIDARGGVDRIVLESLDPGIAELNSTQGDLLFRWCTILISPEKHRLSVTEKGLTDYAGKMNRFVPGLLTLLTGSSLLRSVETPEAVRYEISRECSTPILRDWWERREAVIVARRRAKFRVRSISVAVSAIILTYVIWVILSSK